jgi:hypothetical protein
LYRHRQLGPWDLSLTQHADVGDAFPANALAHGLSCITSQGARAEKSPAARLARMLTSTATRKSTAGLIVPTIRRILTGLRVDYWEATKVVGSFL